MAGAAHESSETDSGNEGVAGPTRALGCLLSLGVLLVVTLASLFAAEGLVRVVSPQQLILIRPDIWQPVDSLGWVHRPLVDTEVNTGERPVRWTTNDEGFRVGADRTEAGSDDGIAVLLLGDSFMAAMQVEYEDSFAGIAEASLSEELGRPVRVDNTAVGAWDPPHYLIKARRLIPERNYDLVLIAVYLGNDVVPARIDSYPRRTPTEIASFRFPRGFSSDEFIESFARPVNDFLKTRSHLFILFKNGLDGLLLQLGLSATEMPWEVQVANQDADAWHVTTEILGDVRDLAERSDTPVLFVLVPSRYQVDEGALVSHGRALGFSRSELDPDQPNRILGDLMRRDGMDVIDPLDHLRDARREGQILYGEIDPHFSPAGHLELWNAVSDTLKRVIANQYAGG